MRNCVLSFYCPLISWMGTTVCWTEHELWTLNLLGTVDVQHSSSIWNAIMIENRIIIQKSTKTRSKTIIRSYNSSSFKIWIYALIIIFTMNTSNHNVTKTWLHNQLQIRKKSHKKRLHPRQYQPKQIHAFIT